MRTALAAMLIFFSANAYADPAEDFAACLVGYSVLALDDGAKTAEDALSVAGKSCSLPDDPDDEIDIDATSAYAYELVQKIVLREPLASE